MRNAIGSDPGSSPTAFRRVAVLHHPKIAESRPLAGRIAAWFEAHGIETWMALSWNEEDVLSALPHTDMLVVLGGDGSILRAARMAAAGGALILGINMGRVGFLSEMTPETWEARMPAILQGRFRVESRMMLRAETTVNGRTQGGHLALNDVVISRGALARVVRLRTQIDGDTLTTYVADGLIIATPTGSTAYSLAAGGPILPPDLRNILLQPIAPHLTLNRAIVLSEGARIRVHTSTDHQAILTIDGQFMFEMQDGDTVDVCASEHVSRFIRLGRPTDFYHSLMARLEPRR